MGEKEEYSDRNLCLGGKYQDFCHHLLIKKYRFRIPM